MLPLPGVMDPWCVGDTPDLPARSPLQRRQGRLCSYTRKKAHRKERQGQEASGSQNWMAVWENQVFCIIYKNFNMIQRLLNSALLDPWTYKCLDILPLNRSSKLVLPTWSFTVSQISTTPVCFSVFSRLQEIHDTLNTRAIEHEGH